jgi:hypothetical protein
VLARRFGRYQRFEVVEHQLGAGEHRECAVVADVAPSQIDESFSAAACTVGPRSRCPSRVRGRGSPSPRERSGCRREPVQRALCRAGCRHGRCGTAGPRGARTGRGGCVHGSRAAHDHDASAGGLRP